MKKIKFFTAFLLLFSAFSFISCDNEPIDSLIDLGSDVDNPGGTVTGTFKVDYDGQTFTATVTQAIVNTDYIAITGLKSATGEFFQITIPNGTVGTYTWSDFDGTSNALGLAYSTGTAESAYVSASDAVGEFADEPSYVDTAEVNIVSLNSTTTNITGTFKFTGVRFGGTGGTTLQTKVFTNGQFNLTYTTNTTSPTENTFFAKLNGADFTPTNIDGFKNSGIISLVGRRGSVENIGLFLPDNVTPGTYDISFGGEYSGTYILNSTGEGVFGGDSGSITITSHDVTNKKIIGTFNFIGTSFFSPATYNVSVGTFNITYL
ncbi:DUF6252 family protein [Flavobacterium sp.]|uniref:DUF6252 family protein n=1 Tax=Flavobacterium sp. TaxID=239 RepID=UPI003750351D